MRSQTPATDRHSAYTSRHSQLSQSNLNPPMTAHLSPEQPDQVSAPQLQVPKRAPPRGMQLVETVDATTDSRYLDIKTLPNGLLESLLSCKDVDRADQVIQILCACQRVTPNSHPMLPRLRKEAGEMLQPASTVNKLPSCLSDSSKHDRLL